MTFICLLLLTAGCLHVQLSKALAYVFAEIRIPALLVLGPSHSVALDVTN